MKTAPEYDLFAEKYTPALMQAAYLLTGQRTAARRLVRGALDHTRRGWKRVDREGGAEAYTRRTLYRRYVSPWRAEPWSDTFPGYQLDAPKPGEQHDAKAAALQASVRRALHTLTRTERALLVLRWYEGCVEDDAALLLGRSPRTVEAKTAAVRERLYRFVPELDHPTDRLGRALSGIAAEAS